MTARASSTLRALTLVTCVSVGAGWIVARLLLLGLDPASESYRNANRIWTFTLACLPVALTALFLSRRPVRVTKQAWIAYGLALAGALALPLDSYVEFYRGDARGWIVFGAGLLTFSVGCVALGHVLRADVMPVFESRVVQSLGLLAFAGSVAGHLFVFFSLLFGFAWTWLGWRVFTSPVDRTHRKASAAAETFATCPGQS